MPYQRTRTTVRLVANLSLIAMLCSSSLSAGELSDLIAPGAKPRKVVGGCRFTEGPAYSPQGFLLFSDIPNSRIVKVLPDGSSSDFLKPSERANGLMFDQSGILYACQGGAHRVVRLDPSQKESVTVLAHSYGGKELNSPNDLALDAHGGLYFTDPHYGRSEERSQEIMGVYYVSADQKLTRVIDDMRRPNGILVSPRGRYLYVAEIDLGQIFRYEITAPGKLGERKTIFTGEKEMDKRGPDGMALDEHGNLYTTYQSLVILNPEGELIGRVSVPEKPANCAFGGKDNKTLYITARTSLYALGMKVAGMKLQPAGPGSSAAKEKTREVVARGLRLRIPESWRQQRPSSSMRLAQFEIPAVKGDSDPGEFVVFYFRGGAGGVEPNLVRWVNQFDAKGRKEKITRGKSTQGNYYLADITGTYNKPVGPPIQRRSKPVRGSRVLAAILQARDGSYYLKLAGPEKTISSVATQYRATFGGKAADEKQYKLAGR